MTEYYEFAVFVRVTMDLDPDTEVRVEPLGGRGSDRTYYRVRWENEGKAILALYDPRRVENGYFANIALFLAQIGVPVPRLIAHDPVRHLILAEDLGGTDLYSMRNDSWQTRGNLYRMTLDVVKRLHSFDIDRIPENLALMDRFGPDLYKWERDYFMEHFVKAVSGLVLSPVAAEALEEELSGLAKLLAEPPSSLVHRDLQSQNIMVRDGDVFLIDFQGLRVGSPFYDLGSLLLDPYVDFVEEEREELLTHYFGLSDFGLGRPAFTKMFYAASAQRLLQALGAYGFLGRKKGLPIYMAHIPAGLRNLTHAAERSGILPRLRELCARCAEATKDSSFL